MTDPLLLAKAGTTELSLLPALANRHGLITGATGTGKTVSLQTLAEQFSRIGVPVFMADVKGDLSGLGTAGGNNAKVTERAAALGVELRYEACPVVFWDVFGKRGHPIRATVSDLGPLLLARLLQLNDTQEGVLNLTFKIADDAGLLLLDLKDLRAMLQHVGEHAAEFTTEYGNVSAASVGAIQRGLLALEAQGVEQLFGEPMLEHRRSAANRERPRRRQHPRGRSAHERAEALRDAAAVDALGAVRAVARGRRSREAATRVLLRRSASAVHRRAEGAAREDRASGAADSLEGRRRLFRDPESARHSGRRARPARQSRAARAACVHAARSEGRAGGRRNDAAESQASRSSRSITELGVGEALVSLLDEKGRPGVTERALIVPPGSQLGPLPDAERARVIAASPIAGFYEKSIDRESAYERVEGPSGGSRSGRRGRARTRRSDAATPQSEQRQGGGSLTSDILFGRRGPRGGRQTQGLVEAMAKSAARSVGSGAGRALIRGLLGSLLGGRS